MMGLFGVAGERNCTSDLYYEVDSHVHLGTQYDGIASIDEIGQPVPTR